MARVRYTPNIGKYLRHNYNTMTIAELAAELGCGKSSVQRWLVMLQLQKNEHGGPGRPKKKVVETLPPPPVDVEHKIVSHSKLYSNISREQHIERILNMAV